MACAPREAEERYKRYLRDTYDSTLIRSQVLSIVVLTNKVVFSLKPSLPFIIEAAAARIDWCGSVELGPPDATVRMTP